MKKMFTSIMATIMAIITGASVSACTVVEEFDPNKTHIIVKCFSGGNGLDWLNALIADFNAANDKYEIISRPQKMSASSVVSEVKANNATADIYNGRYTVSGRNIQRFVRGFKRRPEDETRRRVGQDNRGENAQCRTIQGNGV